MKRAYAGVYRLGFVISLLILVVFVSEGRSATFTVTNTNDSGAGSLRQAITSANSSGGIDTINFNIPGGGVKTIAPLSELPDITFSVVIDGTTQPGWSVGNLVIELSGENLNGLENGLFFFNIDETAPASVVRGLTVNRFPNAGIASNVSSNITIEGCHIGTDPTGTLARGNTVGILLESTIGGFISFNNTIGGATPAERNVISGNSFIGIRIFGGGGHHVTGNYIGTDKTGLNALPNLIGADFLGSNTTIGGASASLRNVISGNNGSAMTINGTNIAVQGNYIGVAADGTTPLGNAGAGLRIIGNGLTQNNNLVGGVNQGEGNTIANNNGDGIHIFRDSTPTTGNRILGNSIFSNSSLGIDLDNNGVTANDTGDGDAGTNDLQNFPVLATAFSNNTSTSITGQLNSAANSSYRIEFFSNSSCDASNNGEGEKFLGATNVTTNALGNANIAAAFQGATLFGQFVTATATRNAAPLDTSEFSACIPVSIETLVVTNTNDAGAGSLRQAIITANADANQTLIGFNIPVQGVQTINLASALPSITAPVVIDGLSQPDAACDAPLIELNGTNAGAGLDGLLISAGNSLVQGLIINRFSSDGISLITNGGNTVRCNRIGTNAAGNADLGNGGNGILASSSSSNTISENTISGNSLSGVRLVSSSNNTIQGNLIGLSADGLTAVGNSAGGVSLFTSGSGNLIGGATVAARNLISGNLGAGIALRDAGVVNNRVQGNFIGTNAAGASLGNSTDGVQIFLSSANGTIGGAGAGEGNVIAFNGNRGVSLQSTAGAGNRISGNSIHSNGTPTNFLGIDLGANGVTANDAGDGDTGANNLQNFPVITSAETFPSVGTTVSGTFNSTANTSFRIEFYTNQTCDALGNGEGENFFGSIDVTTNGSGNAVINHTLPAATVGLELTATATRNAAPFDTSEFSACRTIAAFNPPAISVTNTNDAGAGSLRQAILNANADAAPNTITFNIAGAGLKTISPLSALPTVTQPVIIDALSQPGASCASPAVELNGTNAGAGVDGLSISAGNSVVQGLVINRFGGDGIEFTTVGANVVRCSRIGTSQSGLAGLPNGANGIFLNNVGGNRVGGTSAGDGNLISANALNGILIDGANAPAGGNLIQGNLIGVNAQGNVSAGMSNTQDGVRIQGANASGSTIGGTAAGARNVISNNGDDGIELATMVNSTIIKGNYIGVSGGGNADAGNADRGIVASGTTTVGGTDTAERNVISANTVGIQTVGVSATTTFQGNYVGLGADGTTPLGNAIGVFLNNTNNCLIGGTLPGAGNLISANTDSGVSLDGRNNLVQGNLIGTDATGTLDRGNGSGNTATGAGVSVIDPNNQIGGASAAERNIISGNNFGIAMLLTSATNTTIKNNFIGVDITGVNPLGNSRAGIIITSNGNTVGGPGEGNIIAFNGQNGIGLSGNPVGNRLISNSIYSNNLMGIDLGNNGVVQVNDNLDPDTGANNFQNYPVLAAANATTVTGTFNSSANAQFTLEFFLINAPDASGFGEGKTPLGFLDVTTDANGNANINFTSPMILPNGQFITSTATNLSTGDTSEFSQARQILAPTAANVSIQGRVLNEDGRGIPRTVVTLGAPDGSVRTTLTNPFGYYRFTDLPAGAIYVLTVRHKTYEFDPSSFVINLNEEIDDFVIVGNRRVEN